MDKTKLFTFLSVDTFYRKFYDYFTTVPTE